MATHYRQRTAEGVVPRDGERVELVAVVVGDEASALLKVLRREFELGFRPVGEMLLPARDERLFEPRAERLAAEEPQPARARIEREDALRLWRSRPLEINRQVALVKGVALSGRRRRPGRCERRGDLQRGNLSALFQIEPVVVAPDAFLDRGLASERRATHPGERAGAEMRVVGLAVGRLHDLAVARALQGGVGRVLRRDEMDVRMQRVGAVDGARASHCHGVVVAGAALGGRQVVPAVALVADADLRRGREGCRRRCSSALADQASGARRPIPAAGCRRRPDVSVASSDRRDGPTAC